MDLYPIFLGRLRRKAVLWSGWLPTKTDPLTAGQLAYEFAEETGGYTISQTKHGIEANYSISQIDPKLPEYKRQQIICEILDNACEKFVEDLTGEATVILKHQKKVSFYQEIEKPGIEKNPRARVNETDLTPNRRSR